MDHDTSPSGARLGDGELLAAMTNSAQPTLVVRGQRAADLRSAKVLWCSPSAASLFAASPEEVMDSGLAPFLPATTVMLRRGRGAQGDAVVVAATGAHVRVRLSAAPGIESHVVTLNVVRQSATAERDGRVMALLERSPVPTVVSDVGLRAAHANVAFAALAGREAAELVGTGWLQVLAEGTRESALAALQSALEGQDRRVEIHLNTPAGTRTAVMRTTAHTPDGGSGAAFVATFEDVTDTRAMTARLERINASDSLTGLASRSALAERLDRDLSTETGIAVYFLDLDGFKAVNDTLGHATGDALLIAVARRLATCVRECDMVARLGGDEFVVVTDSPEEMGIVGERLRRALAQPYDLEGQRVSVGASVGAVRRCAEHLGASDILREADAAMYTAKRKARGLVEVLDEGARAAARRICELTRDLRTAIAEGTLSLAYQPVLDAVEPARAYSVEALARWVHPEHGAISPEVFVAIAEANAMDTDLTTMVLQRALSDMVTWREELGEHAPTRVAVNVPPLYLTRTSAVGEILAALAAHGLEGSDLTVEVTESALDGGLNTIATHLGALRAAGVHVSVDDFGTGYSCLSRISELPVDTLKIDASFVRAMAAGGPGAIVAAIVALAGAVGATTVAEGVEDRATLAALGECGVDAIQGWVHAAAMPARALGPWRTSVNAEAAGHTLGLSA